MCTRHEAVAAPPHTAQPRVRYLESSDLRAAAELHRSSLSHGFFPLLGKRFLVEYYRTFLYSPHAVALVAGGEPPDGVLAGVLSSKAHYRWVLRNLGLRLALFGLAALLIRPKLLAMFVRTRLPRYLRAIKSLLLTTRPAASAAEAAPAQYATLAHVAVRQDVRGSGTGAALVECLASEVADAAIPTLRATTAVGPAGAAGFYERTGWRREAVARGWDGQEIVTFSRSSAST